MNMSFDQIKFHLRTNIITWTKNHGCKPIFVSQNQVYRAIQSTEAGNERTLSHGDSICCYVCTEPRVERSSNTDIQNGEMSLK